MYELLTDINGYAKKGSVSELKKFSKTDIQEWIKIGVIKEIPFAVEKETVIENKNKNEKIINRFETDELIELRKIADSLGIEYKQDAGENKLKFLIKEVKKNSPLVKRNRTKKEE